MSAVQIVMSVLVALACVLAVFVDVEGKTSKRLHPKRADRLIRAGKWIPLGIAYALFYMTRYSVVSGNVPAVRDSLGLTTTNFGMVFSCGFWIYGFTGPFTGLVSDIWGAKNTMLLSVFGCGASNLALGAYFYLVAEGAASAAIFATLYALNIFFQGFGTAAVCKLNSGLYMFEERGLFSGIFNILITSGYFLALAVCPVLISSLGWSSVFFVPGGGLVLCGVLIFFTLPSGGSVKTAVSANVETKVDDQDEDIPFAQDGPATIDIEAGDGAKVGEDQKERNKFVELMMNPTFPWFLLAIMCTSWTRDGLLTWMFSFFADAADESALNPDTVALIAGGVTLGGFCGGILCGLISDVLFKGDRIKPLFLFNACLLVALGAMYVFRDSHGAVLAFLVFCICVFLLGNYTLLSYTIPADLSKDLVGTACGVLTAGGYIASGASGIVLGKTIPTVGYFWGWFMLLIFATIIGIVMVTIASRRVQIAAATGDTKFDDVSKHSAALKLSPSKLRSDSVVSFFQGGAFYVSFPELTQLGHKINLTKNAGIADERLRQRYGSTGFYLFPANENEQSVAKRLQWKLEKAKPSQETEQFIQSRTEDATSYFGVQQNGSKLLPY